MRTCRPVPMKIFTDPQTSYRENLGLFVEYRACKLGRKARVVEIGVHEGRYAEVIAERYGHAIQEYVMIEPAIKLQGALLPRLEKLIVDWPKRFPNVKLRHVNELSKDAAPMFPDEYFDWVYIDGLHTYEGVRSDVELFWPKVSPGGIFSGHDFSASSIHARKDPWVTIAPWSGRRANVGEKAGFPGSYKAVVQHARLHALQTYYTLEGRYGRKMWSLTDTQEHFRNNPSWFEFKAESKVDDKVQRRYEWRSGVFTRI